MKTVRGGFGEVVDACVWGNRVVVAMRNGEIFVDGSYMCTIAKCLAVGAAANKLQCLDDWGNLHTLVGPEWDKGIACVPMRDFGPGVDVLAQRGQLVVLENGTYARIEFRTIEQNFDAVERVHFSAIASLCVDGTHSVFSHAGDSHSGEPVIIDMCRFCETLAYLLSDGLGFSVWVNGKCVWDCREEWGAVGLCITSESVFVVTDSSVLHANWVHSPDRIDIVSVCAVGARAALARVNPTLNVIKKYAHVSSSVSMEGLSLSSDIQESLNPSLPEMWHTRLRRVWTRWDSIDGNLLLSTDLALFQLNHKTHSVSEKETPDPFVGVVFGVLYFKHGLVGPRIVNSMQVFGKNDVLLSISKDSTVQFTHFDSVQIESVEQPVLLNDRPRALFPVFPGQHLVSYENHSQLCVLSDSSPCTAASFDDASVLSDTTTRIMIINEKPQSIFNLNIPTIGVYPIGHRGYVQISPTGVWIKQQCVWHCAENIIVVAHEAVKDVFVLLSDGVLLGVGTDSVCVLGQVPVNDPTCMSIHNGRIAVGNFDGEVFLWKYTPGSVLNVSATDGVWFSCGSSIQSVLVFDDRIVAGTRNGRLVLKGASHQIGSLPVGLFREGHSACVAWSDRCVYFRDNGEMLHVPFGDEKIVFSCDQNQVLLRNLDFSKNWVFPFSLKTTNICWFERKIAFGNPHGLVLYKDRGYLLGSVLGGSRAVFSLVFANIGAASTEPVCEICCILPFNQEKEEPICTTVWVPSDFPNGLLVVGTKGKSSGGRLVIFDCESMKVFAKTSVPSKEICAVYAFTPSLLAVGTLESIVLIAAHEGPSGMFPLVLQTVAAVTTFVPIRFISAFGLLLFVVCQNGVVTCYDDQLTVLALLDSPCRIISSCMPIPETETFVCSDTQGLLRVYDFSNVTETGTLKLVHSWDMHGDVINSSTIRNSALLVSTSSGALLQIDKSAILSLN